MKKYLLFPLCAALCLLAGCADDFPTELNHNYYQDDTPPAEPDITEQTVKLGTYNLWISNKGTGDYVWTHRRDILAQSIVNNDWDIFGFQEANSTIQSELPTLVAGKGGNYEWWFVGRDSQDGKNGEALGIAYDPDRFELSDRHYFWLSPTPDEMSYGWDEVSYHRIACCAVVTDKAYGKQFFMMVTHMPLADMARSEAAKVIIEREQMYNTLGMPSVLVGDMNATQDDAASATFRTHWEDAYQATDPAFVDGPVGTFNGHKTSTDLSVSTARIDYIYTRGQLSLKTYKGHTIRNVKTTASGESFGLFGGNEGTIKDLAVENLALSTAFKTAGGVVGTNRGVIDGVTCAGEIVGSGKAAVRGGVAGQNQGVIINCGNRGGKIEAVELDKGVKGENLGGIAGQISKGSDGKGNYIVNCYSWIERVASNNNNIGGIVGIVSDDSFVVNCYSTLADVSQNDSFASSVGYNKKGNVQNVYGNEACPSGKKNPDWIVGNDSKQDGSVWAESLGLLLSLDEMKSGAVTVPSSGQECASFTEALNAGAEIYASTPAETLPAKPETAVRKWVDSDTYPVLE